MRPTGMSEGRATQEQLPRGTAHFSTTEVFKKWSKAKTAFFALAAPLRLLALAALVHPCTSRAEERYREVPSAEPRMQKGRGGDFSSIFLVRLGNLVLRVAVWLGEPCR